MPLCLWATLFQLSSHCSALLWGIWAESPFDFCALLIIPLSRYTQKASILTKKHCVHTSGKEKVEGLFPELLRSSQGWDWYFFAVSVGKSPKKVVLEESENVLDIVAVHLKWNTTSIKQTWRTRPIHQRAAWISYWVQLRRDKCRTSSVCPRLPIDRDHHCDVAFYLTTCSLKLYIILFPTRRSHRKTRRVEKGHGSDCIFYSQFVLLSFVQTVFMAWDDHPCPAAANF